jgi:tRNA threonylcarbamoyladenosine biosynthesis protein TsaB
MILLIDTSTATCKLTIVRRGVRTEHTWEAGRDMARGLLEFIVQTLEIYDERVNSLQGIGVFRGPGSFTGLRIGVTTANTLAHFAQIPLVGTTGASWQDEAAAALGAGRDDRQVVPEYGREARITQPRK